MKPETTKKKVPQQWDKSKYTPPELLGNVSWMYHESQREGIVVLWYLLEFLLDIFIVITHHNPTYRPLITPTDYLFFFPPTVPKDALPATIWGHDQCGVFYVRELWATGHNGLNGLNGLNGPPSRKQRNGTERGQMGKHGKTCRVNF